MTISHDRRKAGIGKLRRSQSWSRLPYGFLYHTSNFTSAKILVEEAPYPN